MTDKITELKARQTDLIAQIGAHTQAAQQHQAQAQQLEREHLKLQGQIEMLEAEDKAEHKEPE